MKFSEMNGGDPKGFYGIGKSSMKRLPSHIVSQWTFQNTQENNFKVVVDALKDKDIKTVLDVGCGLGSIIDFLPKDVEYHGIDMLEDIIDIARENHPNAKFEVADILDYKTEEKYDSVICNGAFNCCYGFGKFQDALEKMKQLTNKMLVVTISYIDYNELNIVRASGYDVYPLRSVFGDRGDDWCISMTK